LSGSGELADLCRVLGLVLEWLLHGGHVLGLVLVLVLSKVLGAAQLEQQVDLEQLVELEQQAEVDLGCCSRS